MTIIINGQPYAPDETVAWGDAIAIGGFYYCRAEYLGLPEPPAILFDETAHGYLEAMGRYHALWREAEADMVARVRHTWD